MFGEEFYPTPRAVAYKMLSKISKDAENILEPSAGKGDLAEAILKSGTDSSWRNDRSRFKVDCIEADPELATLLVGKGLPVVGFDWLTYEGVCYYDAIIMNPPFSNGADHLLRAWDFLHDGEIVCLLNEETVKNPHTAARQRLAGIIAKHGTVDYLGDCFKSAQRKTSVNVAMVYLKKVSEDDRIEVWATKTGDEKPVDDSIGGPDNMLAIADNLGNMEHYYNMANEHMLKAFAHVRKASLYMDANHITSSHGKDQKSYSEILGLAMCNIHSARAEFGRKHRRDAWFRVFNQMEFHKWLDKKQREELLRDVEKNSTIPFTADNIKGTLENVFLQRKRLFEQSVANVFDALIKNFAGNGATEGWKTNDNYKVNEKLIFPYGLRYEPQYKAIGAWGQHYGDGPDIYCDLDRVLCVLAGREFAECCTVGHALEAQFQYLNYHPNHSTSDQATESEFFEIRFFKKRTLHLKFKDRDLWERFNVTAAAGKKWLGMNTNDKSEFPGRRPQYKGRKHGANPVSMAEREARIATESNEPIPKWCQPDPAPVLSENDAEP
jgi:hypothetical protein